MDDEKWIALLFRVLPIELALRRKQSSLKCSEFYESQKLPRPNLILNGFNMDDKRVNKYYSENLLSEANSSSNSKTNIFSKLRFF